MTSLVSGTKNLAVFLTELGERTPVAVLAGFSILFPLMDGEVSS